MSGSVLPWVLPGIVTYAVTVILVSVGEMVPARGHWPLALTILVYAVWPLWLLIMLPHRVVVRLAQPTERRKIGDDQ